MIRNTIITAVIGLTVLGGWLAAPASHPVASPAAVEAEFPEDWHFANRPQKLKDLIGKAAPELSIKTWHGKQPKAADSKGKVRVIDFWATWCGPCMRSIPHNVEMVKKHQKDGLVFIGVHDSKRGMEKIAKTIKDNKINYPIGVDDGGKSVQAFGLSFWPTYVVVDRNGIVRAAGLRPDRVDDVVEKLLPEKPKDAKDSPAKES